MTAPADGLWARLGRVRRVRLTVELPGTNGAGGGLAAGSVESEIREKHIVWRERGTWETGDLAGSRFFSALRWELVSPELIRLEHLRRGVDAPVALVSLSPDGANHWRETAPHLCGADRYHADLALTPDALHLVWRVTGPAKTYLLRTEYR